MSKMNLARPSDWRDAAFKLILADDRGWSVPELVHLLGAPPGLGTAASLLADTAKRGRLRAEGNFGTRVYFATSTTQEGKSRVEFLKNLGRDAPRVNSVWDYAGRAA
jgi:hypothetical protein